ncbi:MAG: putative hemolysin [Bacteroidetes bacterium]|jgi:CBS domain containing-hemolysin-like protein|nr:putative hemolysin [Bacteroidota bacterium]
MIASVVCILISLGVGFLLTLQQVHFAIVVSSKSESERGTSIRDSIVKGFYRKPKQFLGATSLAKLFFFSMFAVFFYNFIFSETILFQTPFRWVAIIGFILIASSLYIFCCEFLPRLFYNYESKHLSIRRLVVPITLVYVFFYPWVSLFSHIGNLIFRYKKNTTKEKGEKNSDWGESTFDISVKEQLEGNNDPEMETERQIIRNVIDFSSTRVKDSMIPRTEIVSVNLETATVKELKEKFSLSGHSRVIVFNGDIDHVVGYIHSLEMFQNQNNWQEHIKEVPFVPETMAAHDLMKDLMQKQKNLAVVVDEFGGTVGIISLEDLVEEIFGEIEDEHDKKSFIERKINDKEYIFAGRMEIDYINEQYNLNLPVSEDYLTLAGYLIYVNERFPKLNQVITVKNISFTILKMSPTKVELVKVAVNS